MPGYFLRSVLNFKTQRLGHGLFLASCGLFLVFFAAGAVYRLTRPGDPVLVHFSALGNAFADRGQVADAVESYSELLEIRPSPEIEFNLANTLAASGNTAEAIEHYQRAVKLNPAFQEAHYNLANLLAGQGDMEPAFTHYRLATAIDDRYLDAWFNWAVWEFRTGRGREAAEKLTKVLALNPGHDEARLTLALVLLQNRDYAGALRELEEGVRRSPEHLNLSDTLAWVLATAPEAGLRDGARAVRIAEQVRAAGPDDPQRLDTLAAAYAESGRFADAVKTVDLALDLAARQGNETLEGVLRQRRGLYARQQPYREP